MPRFYRIVQEAWVATALTGEGARRYGGRWNPPGVAGVYLAESRALAALEILVHAPREALLLDWAIIEMEIPETMIDRVPVSKLPDAWRENPTSRQAQVFGGRWLVDQRKLALLLPSVVIPEENALLLNPAHSDFQSLQPGLPQRFNFDPRLSGTA